MIPKPMEKPLTRTDAERAAQTLGLSDIDAVELADVSRAFRTLLRAAHPDASKRNHNGAVERIAELKAARTTLLEWIASRPKASCPVCRGQGAVRGGAFGSRPCPRCG